ncbi:S-adenosyl-L-methionine-dependent tRNA 4-demethylwyosine synthase [Neolecta irregularis DAH-3]|uniref:S-adenosyl-L-methionine-dependent tRNA 4-demethylwyosine synthase n=1 Tax=Neolecta irregularis (strain DAH-3) TaxID=1198029 RepID=A0A1U7LTY4_NEOID|nr:S-adenosyl-L-methionine-dependent tRNA 4-demethylwyosine synthase [Neolecta irregularis DAH-3]|eukprot:OLL26078.1 S-adenosyl-L-methionine-dependent tRNA 4-demethylwyosine synthase [Neolecta irregularis DAH-3]
MLGVLVAAVWGDLRFAVLYFILLFTAITCGADFTREIPANIFEKKIKRKIKGSLVVGQKKKIPQKPVKLTENSVLHIFYSSLNGSTERFAQSIVPILPYGHHLHNIDYLPGLDEYFSNPAKDSTYLLIVPSYNTQSPLDYLLSTLRDIYHDFRVGKNPLLKVNFAVFGIGDGDYAHEFCYQAKEADKLMGKLGARRLLKVQCGDIRVDAQGSIEKWATVLHDLLLESPDLTPDDSPSDSEEDAPPSNSIADLEDMGAIMKISRAPGVKEMVSKDSPTYNALTKQGYKIVGTHSGVKICRWTKSALRGRGSCYKFSFYGIRSHNCMETTPSLACANKCVFCWRHGTNPVGTSWRWKIDPPAVILEGAIKGHLEKIKTMKGVPGLRLDRFEEAQTIKHCALSLVGEPIFYPHINEFVSMLHERHISSFLVTNAQHPDAMARMGQVTQLYVSIDASTKESLKAVDRPLFKDFWERFLKCLDILSTKRQRTIYRLTLVKGYNVREIGEYAELVKRGKPCFIEIKGVTYCGNSDQSNLTMSNVPYFDEVVTFTEKLVSYLGPSYGIAAEHEHSNCILVARKEFSVDGVWHTWINYDRFFELIESGEEFGPEDYMSPTPAWAVFGMGGFNPEDERWRRKKKEDAKSEKINHAT